MSYPVGMTAELPVIETCPVAERAAALQLLHGGLSADQQAALPAALESVRDQGEDALSGLFVGRHEGAIVASTWVQLAPGRTAVLWPPAIGTAASAGLMRAAESFVQQRRIALAQMLIHPDAPQDPELLSQGGFRFLVDLDYLALESSHFPSPTNDGELTFQPFSQVERARFVDVLMESYNETLDCPQLNGVRTPEDILTSYQAQGEYSADRWFLVQQVQQDVGVLILTRYPVNQNWELVYMGVVPRARGNQFGQRIVRFALSQASHAGAARLVLAADANNAPALSMYHAAGLFTWDQRRVYARLEERL